MIRFETDLSSGRRLLQYRGVTSNSYLVVDTAGERTCLVDCGMPSDVPGLLKVLGDLPPIEKVVCTHFHIDHVTGWFGLKKALPHLRIWFRQPARPWVSGQQRLPAPGWHVIHSIFLPVMREYGYWPGLRDLIASGLFGTGFRPGFPTDGLRFFEAAEAILPGFETLATPGHRPEHTSFWDPQDRVLLCGDFLVRIADEVITYPFLSSVSDQTASLASLDALGEIRLLCAGHGKCAPWTQAAGSSGGAL